MKVDGIFFYLMKVAQLLMWKNQKFAFEVQHRFLSLVEEIKEERSHPLKMVLHRPAA